MSTRCSRSSSRPRRAPGDRSSSRRTSHEHFGHVVSRRFAVPDQPVADRAATPTNELDELLATKLRALYQRRKGRDLFDLWCSSFLDEVRPAARPGVAYHPTAVLEWAEQTYIPLLA